LVGIRCEYERDQFLSLEIKLKLYGYLYYKLNNPLIQCRKTLSLISADW
jgi:hypothetical protein